MNSKIILKFCQIIADVVFAVSLALIISYSFFTPCLQHGFSMVPYINDSNVVLVNRLYRRLFKLKRKDVIVFYVDGQESIRRIYGLPGETITINSGNFYINDVQMQDFDLKNSLSSNISQNVKLASDEYYVLGDSLDNSMDSRSTDIGNIKRENIIGKVWFVVK